MTRTQHLRLTNRIAKPLPVTDPTPLKLYAVRYISKKTRGGSNVRHEWYETEFERDTAYAVMSKTHEGVEKFNSTLLPAGVAR